MTRTGFTVVELVVVVLILSVLVAIAVPNLREARTRSQVTRVQNDSRVASIALEAYHVDYRMYPLRPINPQNIKSVVMALPTSLTTPVSYLGGTMRDPYGQKVLGLGYMYLDWGNITNPSLPQSISSFKDGLYAYGNWSVFSKGPDLQYGPSNYGGMAHVLMPYDPTNGSASQGDIIRSFLSPSGRPRLS